jgi:phenylacetate-CoA ligase
MDVMTVQLETEARDPAAYERSVAEVLKLKGRVELLSLGSLPNDGKVIDDQRVYD